MAGYALCDFSTYGPAFGSGRDLYLSDSCHTNQESYSRLGYTYETPGGYGSSSAMVGTKYFTCDDYEVFYLA